MTIPQYYVAGSLASIPISVVEAPVDLFKIKLQAQVRPACLTHDAWLFLALLRTVVLHRLGECLP